MTDQLTVRRQLVAGDGFQACNERLLVFGLGHANSIDHLTVTWPNGKTDSYADVPIKSELTVIEGCRSYFDVPR